MALWRRERIEVQVGVGVEVGVEKWVCGGADKPVDHRWDGMGWYSIPVSQVDGKALVESIAQP